MDLHNFFNKCSVENQHSNESNKFNQIVERHATVDREQLFESSNSKKE